MRAIKHLFIFVVILLTFLEVNAKSIYINALEGKDTNSGLSQSDAIRTLDKLKEFLILPGDSILLASDQEFKGTIHLKNAGALSSDKIVISSYMTYGVLLPARIDAGGHHAGVVLENCAHILVSYIEITADAGGEMEALEGIGKMRCGVLILTNTPGNYGLYEMDNLDIHDIFYELPGFTRDAGEVKTANGTQSYGWGVRVINANPESYIDGVTIRNTRIYNVSHTGIKFTVKGDYKTHRIKNIGVYHTNVLFPGGPGIQMSGVEKVLVSGNIVDHSGSNNDSRKWGRGSGLWTWGSNDVLVERNKFMNANGPGDSAGAHIDFNCNNVVFQYNFSARNAGGFLEILGNNYNCSYRYNISVNDGHRIKGRKGAFQEGKVFWLSGYQGDKKRSGPFNSYIYNNTIYTSEEINVKIAVDKAASGILIANNIFHFEGESQLVLGDQYVPDKGQQSQSAIENVIFTHNLFLNNSNWPQEAIIQPTESVFGNAKFFAHGSFDLVGYMPTEKTLVQDRGIDIPYIPGDTIGLKVGLQVDMDILGNKIVGKPDIGAIEVSN